MDSQNIDVLKPVLADVISLCILGLFNVYVAKVVKPTKRGLFCNDESIRYPFHESTVPASVLDIVGVLLPLLIIVFFELKNSREHVRGEPVYVFGTRKIKMVYWNIYKTVCCFGSGAIFCQLLTDVGKKVVGRLRPNFMSVCNSNFTAICVPGSYSYIENFKCEVPDEKLDGSRVSFPSGHTSFAFYVAVFLVLYLQKRLKMRPLLIKPTIQFLFILLAWYVGLTRVMDNKHHWSDVLAGLLLGAGVAIINTVLVHRLLDSKKNLVVNVANGNRSINTALEAHDQL